VSGLEGIPPETMFKFVGIIGVLGFAALVGFAMMEGFK